MCRLTDKFSKKIFARYGLFWRNCEQINYRNLNFKFMTIKYNSNY